MSVPNCEKICIIVYKGGLIYWIGRVSRKTNRELKTIYPFKLGFTVRKNPDPIRWKRMYNIYIQGKSHKDIWDQSAYQSRGEFDPMLKYISIPYPVTIDW